MGDGVHSNVSGSREEDSRRIWRPERMVGLINISQIWLRRAWFFRIKKRTWTWSFFEYCPGGFHANSRVLVRNQKLQVGYLNTNIETIFRCTCTCTSKALPRVILWFGTNRARAKTSIDVNSKKWERRCLRWATDEFHAEFEMEKERRGSTGGISPMLRCPPCMTITHALGRLESWMR